MQINKNFALQRTGNAIKNPTQESGVNVLHFQSFRNSKGKTSNSISKLR